MKTYTYKIVKRHPRDGLNGYGYSLIIYENKKVFCKNGAYGSRIMAKISWGDFIDQIRESRSIKSFSTV